jgi:hypothetical protein
MRAYANPDQSLDLRRLGEPDWVGLARRMRRPPDPDALLAVDRHNGSQPQASQEPRRQPQDRWALMRRASRRSRLAQAPRIPR